MLATLSLSSLIEQAGLSTPSRKFSLAIMMLCSAAHFKRRRKFPKNSKFRLINLERDVNQIKNVFTYMELRSCMDVNSIISFDIVVFHKVTVDSFEKLSSYF